MTTGQAFQFAAPSIQDDTGIRKSAIAVPPSHKFNNAVYAYGLDVCISPDDVFFAARISYTYTSAGD